jgi:hypothetical protein
MPGPEPEPCTPEPKPSCKRKDPLFSPPSARPHYSKRHKQPSECSSIMEPPLPAIIKLPKDFLRFAKSLDHHTDWNSFFTELVRKIEHPTESLKFRLKINEILSLSNKVSGTPRINQQYKAIAQVRFMFEIYYVES